MIGFVAYLALTVAIPALLLGHQGQDFPPCRWRRTLAARKARARGCVPAGAPQTPSRDSRITGASERAAEARTRPRPAWVHEQPINIEEAA